MWVTVIRLTDVVKATGGINDWLRWLCGGNYVLGSVIPYKDNSKFGYEVNSLLTLVDSCIIPNMTACYLDFF